jgi:hypothetical protein
MSQSRLIHQRIMLKATMSIAIPEDHKIMLVVMNSEACKGWAPAVTDAAATNWTPITTGPQTANP